MDINIKNSSGVSDRYESINCNNISQMYAWQSMGDDFIQRIFKEFTVTVSLEDLVGILVTRALINPSDTQAEFTIGQTYISPETGFVMCQTTGFSPEDAFPGEEQKQLRSSIHELAMRAKSKSAR